jgi:MFS family permease
MTGSAATVMIVESNLIFYVVDVRHLPLAVVGTVFAAHGLGSILGALIAPRLCQRFRPGLLIVAALFGAGVCTGLLATAGGVLTMALGWGGAGVCVMLVVVVWFTLRQRLVPEHLLGRVVAASRTLAYAATPLGALVGAWLLAAGGGSALILVSAAGQVAVALAAVATALGRARFPEPALEPTDTPRPAQVAVDGAAP